MSYCDLCRRQECLTVAPAPLVERIVPNIGYRPKDNLRRWGFIEREIFAEPSRDFTCLEVGSNYGYMSLALANAYPNARVFSVEGSFGTGNEGTTSMKASDSIVETEGIRSHLRARDALGLWNDVVCCGLVLDSTYERLREARIMFDYQISLSVFHWVVDASKLSLGASRSLLAEHIRAAKVTFLELPSMEQENALRGIYGGHESVAEAVVASCSENELDVRVTYLGSCDWYGTRDTFRVEVVSDERGDGARETRVPCKRVVEVLDVRVVPRSAISSAKSQASSGASA